MISTIAATWIALIGIGIANMFAAERQTRSNAN
jgi:hypothetical protein